MLKTYKRKKIISAEKLPGWAKRDEENGQAEDCCTPKILCRKMATKTAQLHTPPPCKRKEDAEDRTKIPKGTPRSQEELFPGLEI